MALSLLTYSIKIPTTASTVVVRPVLPIRSSLPSLRLTFPLRTPTSFISCCSSVSEKAATSGIDLKPDVERWPKYIPNKLPDKNYVRVLDTTLRDGEQSPGGALTPAQKLEIARKLAKLRVDVMDVGFPASSEEELEAVKTIAKTVGNEVDEETGYVPVICVISRCKHKDIEAAWEALKYAKKPRIYIFICTSEIHMKYKLKKTKEEVIEMAKSSIRFAKKLGFTDIQFGCEDGGRSEKDFLCKIMGEAIKEGVKTVTLADTVGINIPQEFGEMVTYLKANTPGIDDVVVSLHCHNDLGLATANTIAVHTSHIMAASRMVQEYTGLHVQPHKPIVGNNCFLHESGIHQVNYCF
ncbi:hypothetical protein IGI04_006844 [Brassica rapa subsp. trilocularis]|uniref:Pyruvate carboxyltransferase domain-containing protein n=1 Tax=Brassica rapa subsp. trilocularis TaxID=1813537 RepID=A0ABQ7NI14_BRACM|nr:hypothetical protein IGI04_006844 [Brassica rapa subsp. trilocularis]